MRASLPFTALQKVAYGLGIFGQGHRGRPLKGHQKSFKVRGFWSTLYCEMTNCIINIEHCDPFRHSNGYIAETSNAFCVQGLKFLLHLVSNNI